LCLGAAVSISQVVRELSFPARPVPNGIAWRANKIVPTLQRGNEGILTITDSEIGDPERDAETEGPEFSSGSVIISIYRSIRFRIDRLCHNRENT
jgi:hypothetical protein